MTKKRSPRSDKFLDRLRDELDPGGFSVEVNEDETLRYVSRFKKGRGSLEAIGAQGLVESLNKLGLAEMITVINCVKHAPFPMGEYDAVFARIFAAITEPETVAKWPALELGKTRRALCLQYCHGCNAPGDSYVRAAVRHVEEHGLFNDALVEDPRQGKLFEELASILRKLLRTEDADYDMQGSASTPLIESRHAAAAQRDDRIACADRRAAPIAARQ